MSAMNLAVVSCEVFRREFEGLSEGLPHSYRFTWVPFALHNTPEKMASALQEIVDRCVDVDAVLLGYGLCSRGIVGVTARHVPIVVPRAHDCMTLFLGSRERYRQEFSANPGTYYYSPGWVDRYDPNASQSHFVPNTEAREAARARQYAQYVELYGEDNAKYLIELETAWQSHYSRTAFIDTGYGNKEYYRAFVKHLAESNSWSYDEIAGDTSLMRRFLNAEWNEDFLIVQPGESIRDIVNDDIITVERRQPPPSDPKEPVT